MCKDVGKIAGIVAGAACQLIPGVGTVGGLALLAACGVVGTGVDALIEAPRQEQQADNAANAAREQVAIETERQRISARRAQEEEAARISGEQAAGEAIVEEDRQTAQRERAIEERRIRHQQEQTDLVAQSVNAYRTETVEQIPGDLQRMDDEHFDIFRRELLHSANTADARERFRTILEHEEMRREIVDSWNNDIAGVVPTPTRPRPVI